MDIEKRLEAEQHEKLKELQEKLSDVLDYEPADTIGHSVQNLIK